MPESRPRIHKIVLDLFDWEQQGKDYQVTMTIDESKLADLVARAVKRHDGRTELAGGGITIEARKVT
jgi:hypothetical protein